MTIHWIVSDMRPATRPDPKLKVKHYVLVLPLAGLLMVPQGRPAEPGSGIISEEMT
jgi:hypothetical protein